MPVKKVLVLLTILFSLFLSACPVDEIKPPDGGKEEGKYLWLVGAVNNWSLKYPLAFTSLPDDVFVWQGELPAGQLHFSGDPEPSYAGTWYGPQSSGEIPPINALAAPMFRNNYNWNITTPGWYAITADIAALQVRFEYDPDGAGSGEPVTPHEKGRYGNYYEIFVGSFYSSKNNGMGDLKGVTQKLDYLNDGNPNSNASLHIDGIWFMPINPSPTYHKYDVTNYTAIDSAYGAMADFEELIAECNKRGIRVIIDLVVNHTSTRHSWFTQALSGSATYQAYYNISNTKPNNSWYPFGSTGKYYEAVFWDQMPDLNWDNPAVKTQFQNIIDFWFGKGVAGFRLDAVKHIYDSQQKNIEWLKWFTDYCKSKKSDVYIVSEVWDSEATIQNYISSGIPSSFNFPAAQNYIPTYVRYTPAKNFSQFVVNWNSQIKARNPIAIDAPFINNHDINRFPAIIGTDSVKLKMSAAMLIFMPGNPFIYYGEELGMTGAGKDEDKRGPMVWSRTDTTGKTKGPSGNSQAYWNASSVAEQISDHNSMARFYIDALKLKNRYPAIHWGTPSMITTTADNYIAAYKISGKTGEKDLAVVHNLGNSGQTVIISGVSALGGTLSAEGYFSSRPVLSGDTLNMPAYTSAVLEY